MIYNKKSQTGFQLVPISIN